MEEFKYEDYTPPKDTRTQFERIILPILKNIGLIGSALLVIAYVAVIMILILGFEINYKADAVILFAVINAVIGLLMMFMLKLQGTIYAKNKPENQVVLTKYYNTKTKDKKFKSITNYWISSTIKDIIFKGISIAAASGYVVFISIKGSNDYMMLVLALVNLLMFTSFGLLAMNRSYEYYNNMHIPYINEQIKLREEDIKNGVETIHKPRYKLSKQNEPISSDANVVREFLSKELQRERPPKQ